VATESLCMLVRSDLTSGQVTIAKIINTSRLKWLQSQIFFHFFGGGRAVERGMPKSQDLFRDDSSCDLVQDLSMMSTWC
jgi:hypothetical protein